MPVYVYECAGCGPFELLRPMAMADADGAWPACGAHGRRVFTPPAVALLARPLRAALDREEKSAYEPAVVAQKQGRPLPHHHAPSPPWVMSH